MERPRGSVVQRATSGQGRAGRAEAGHGAAGERMQRGRHPGRAGDRAGFGVDREQVLAEAATLGGRRLHLDAQVGPRGLEGLEQLATAISGIAIDGERLGGGAPQNERSVVTFLPTGSSRTRSCGSR